MKKIFPTLMLLVVSAITFAQVTKTLQVNIPGSLNSLLTTDEKSSITFLSIIGDIDVQDFVTMRDEMPNLTEINLSEAKIVGYKGDNGTAIEKIYFANSLPKSAFRDCSKLVAITLPSTITKIESASFKGCAKLTSIVIPTSVIKIEDLAFGDCAELKVVSLPSSLVSIDSNLFYNCPNLVSVEIDKANLNYSSENGVLYDKTKTKIFTFPASKNGNYILPTSVISVGNALFYGSLLDSIVMTSSVKSIGSYSFCECKNLSSITIKSSSFSVGDGAFESCTNLKTINLYAKIPAKISTNVFAKINNKDSIVLNVPVGSRAAYQSAVGWKEFKNIVELNF